MSPRSVVFLHHIPKTAGQSIRHALSDALGLHDGFVQVGPFGDKRREQAGLPTLEQSSAESLASARVLAGHYLRSDMRAKFPDTTIESAIVLREPAARLVSHYNHAMFIRTTKCGESVIDFERWYLDEAAPHFPWERIAGRTLDAAGVRTAMASVGHNYMSKFVLHAHGDMGYPDYDDDVLLARTVRILNDFAHVGAVDAIQATFDFLSRTLGRPIVARRHNVAGSKRPRVLTLTDDVRRSLEEQNRVDVEIYARCRAKLAAA